MPTTEIETGSLLYVMLGIANILSFLKQSHCIRIKLCLFLDLAIGQSISRVLRKVVRLQLSYSSYPETPVSSA